MIFSRGAAARRGGPSSRDGGALAASGYGDRPGGQAPRVRSRDEPLPTIVAGAAKFALTQFHHGTGQARRIGEPLPTVTTRAAIGLVAEGAPIAMRLLRGEELAAAQGFPREHKLPPTNNGKIRIVGNSVPPDVAAAIFTANAKNS